MRRFELVEGKSSKFWEGSAEGTSLTVRFGRIGTSGQLQTKSFADEKKATAELAKLIAEKVKKGYSEIASASGEAASESPTVAAPTTKAKPKAAGSTAGSTAQPTAEPMAIPDGFLPGDKGYLLGLDGKKLVARNPAGKVLSSVPKELRESELAEQLLAVADWMTAHALEAVEWTETFMLRSLPVPAAVIGAVWADDAYRSALENLVVFAATQEGAPDRTRGGLLKGVDPARGVGVVDRDGETAWLKVDEILVPHPIILEALDDWRALAQELTASQGAQQLFREVFSRPSDLAAETTTIGRFTDGAFKQLNHAFGAAKTLGFRVSGGSALARVLEGGRTLEARYWLGEGDPLEETITGELFWVDDQQRSLPVQEVSPIAFSEGMRMASAIFAKRVIEEKKEEA